MRGSGGLQRTTAPRLVERHCESRSCNARRTVALEQNLGADSRGSLICAYGHASARGCDRKANGPHQRAIRFMQSSSLQCYSGEIFDACLPFAPCVTSKLTFWFSCSDLKPLP